MYIEAFESLARTATPTAAKIQVPQGISSAVAVIDVTAITATPSITVTISGFDPTGTDATWTLLASAAITTVTTVVLQIAPWLTEAANSKAAQTIPDVIEVAVAHGDADSITYSIGVFLR